MHQIAWFVLQVVDTLTFGWVSRGRKRAGELPDPSEVWDEERRRLDDGRVAGESLFGRTGTAVTPLRPVGRIELDGRGYQATAQSGFIDAGAPVEVVDRSGFGLIVRPTPGGEQD